MAKAARREPPRSEGLLVDVIPEPIKNSDLKIKLGSLFVECSQFVSHFYKRKVAMTDEIAQAVHAFDSGHLPRPLVVLLASSDVCRLLIQHSLCWFVSELISYSCDPEMSFLPPELSELPFHLRMNQPAKQGMCLLFLREAKSPKKIIRLTSLVF